MRKLKERSVDELWDMGTGQLLSHYKAISARTYYCDTEEGLKYLFTVADILEYRYGPDEDEGGGEDGVYLGDGVSVSPLTAKLMGM